MKQILYICMMLVSCSMFAQVGINTTTPDPSAMLDIEAVDKGLLIPRVSLSNISDTMLDGSNIAATGLLIYNTNASVTGGDGIGYYSFNGTTWEKIITSTSGSIGGDADFYEEGTTDAPDDINDDIYTQGNVAIGKTNALYALDVVENTEDRAISAQISGASIGAKYGNYILNNNSGSGVHYGTANTLSGAGVGTHYGSFQNLSTGGGGPKYGVYSRITGAGNAARYGTYNWITSATSGDNTGTYNILDGTGSGPRYGTQNIVNSNSTGRIYGTYNTILGNGTERKFGSYNFINQASGGTHFAIYAEARKVGSFAGLFNGRVAIGESSFISGTPDWYVLPATRGTNGQIMQTDAAGNVSWVDASTVGSEDADFYEVGTTNAPNAITDDIFTQGALAIGKNTASARLDVEDNTNTGTSLQVTSAKTMPATGEVVSIKNNVTATGTSGAIMLGQENVMGGTASRQYAIKNTFENAATNGVKWGMMNDFNTVIGTSSFLGIANYMYGEADSKRGVSNFINARPTFPSGGSTSGVRNDFAINGAGFHDGISNSYLGVSGSSGTLRGVNNTFNLGGNGSFYGTYNFFGTSTTGTGPKYGTYTEIPAGVGGTHVGIYADVRKSNSYAAFLIGRTAIGSTPSNTYILPSARGTNGQIMQTDGSGNVSWADLSAATNDWSVLGNSGTNPATNFLGTTDNQDMVFKSNNTEAFRIKPDGNLDSPNSNIRWGTNAGSSLTTGAQNILLGDNSGFNITERTGTIAIGANAFRNLQNSWNYQIAIGFGAAQSTTTGGNNLAIGALSLQDNTIGSGNIGIGVAALNSNINGSANLAIGGGALSNNISGNQNTVFGSNAGLRNTGSGNTLVGYFASIFTTAGNNNTVVGNEAGRNGDMGNENVLLGANSGRQLTGSANIFLGNDSGSTLTGVSNRLVIDNSSTTTPLIYGEFDTNLFRINGSLQIGIPSATGYTFPNVDGATNQILQTDGSGNVNWVNNSSSSFWSRTGTEIDVATTADDISFSSDQTSIIFPTTLGTPSSMIHLFDSGTANADRMVLSQSPTFNNWGLMYRDSNDSFRFVQNGTDRVVVNLAGGNPLVVNGTAQATAFQSATTTYPDYVFESYFEGTSAINPAYKFKTLEENFEFIKANGHLPGVKSYNEVKKDNMQFNLTETTIKNLEKVEELFLYTYELQQENKQLKEAQKELNKRLERLEKALLKK